MDKMRSIWTWFELDISVLCGLNVLQMMKVDMEVAHDEHGFSCSKSIIFYCCMITAY